MKPLHVQIRLTDEAAACQWFGASAIHAAGSAQYDLRADAETHFVPDPCLNDLKPLLSKIAGGDIGDAETLARADEFLLLRDLLEPEDFSELTDTLFRFLYPLSQQLDTLVGIQKSDDGRVWVDPDRRLVRVWFSTNRKIIMDGDAVNHFSSLQSSDEITYGVCNVFIPESHKPGSTGTPWWRRWIPLETDDALKLHSAHDLPSEVFWAGLRNKLSGWWNEGERNLFVHSMGNRGFLSVLERITAIGKPELSLGQVFFWAPDEDVRVFKEKVTLFPHRSEHRTLLVSPEDKAVFASWEKHGQLDRVGYVSDKRPVTVIQGIETVEVGGFRMLDLGHGYFASAEPVIRDMHEAITTRRPAAQRKSPRQFKNHFVIDIRETS